MKKRYLANALAALTMALPAFSAPASLYSQAVADYNSGAYGKAASEFEQLKVAYPNNALTRYYLALCRQALGHFEKAKEEYTWVSQYGDANLKNMAATGMARMSGARTSTSSGSVSRSGATNAVPSNRPPAGAKVKKILEFYADW